MKIPTPTSFEWDQGNQRKSWHKHQVHHKETEEVFFNKPIQIYPDTKHSTKEERFVAYGITNKSKNLTIIFTIRNNKIRVISARIQNKKERQIYEKASK